jgi:hypothetical protein
MATGSATDASSTHKLVLSSSFMNLEEIDEIPELVDLQTPKTIKTANFLGIAEPIKSSNSMSLKSWPKRQKSHFDSGDYFCEKEISKAIEGSPQNSNQQTLAAKTEPSALPPKRWNSVQLGYNSGVSKGFESSLGFGENQASLDTLAKN